MRSYIISDTIITETAKRLLLEYIDSDKIEDIHTTLGVTFEEILQSVLSRIEINIHKNEIKAILSEEIQDSQCKCFTGRISRLINCLNVFDELVSVQISDSEQIGNVITFIRNKLEKSNTYSVELHKELVFDELTNRDYDTSVINEYIAYIE